MPYEDQAEKRCFKWGYVAAAVLVSILVCTSLPFVVTHARSKQLLWGLIATVLIVLLVTILLTEWFRRKSGRKKREARTSRGSWAFRSMERVEIRTETISSSHDERRTSKRTSWTQWLPKKFKPSAPPPSSETEIY